MRAGRPRARRREAGASPVPRLTGWPRLDFGQMKRPIAASGEAAASIRFKLVTTKRPAQHDMISRPIRTSLDEWARQPIPRHAAAPAAHEYRRSDETCRLLPALRASRARARRRDGPRARPFTPPRADHGDRPAIPRQGNDLRADQARRRRPPVRVSRAVQQSLPHALEDGDVLQPDLGAASIRGSPPRSRRMASSPCATSSTTHGATRTRTSCGRAVSPSRTSSSADSPHTPCIRSRIDGTSSPDRRSPQENGLDPARRGVPSRELQLGVLRRCDARGADSVRTACGAGRCDARSRDDIVRGCDALVRRPCAAVGRRAHHPSPARDIARPFRTRVEEIVGPLPPRMSITARDTVRDWILASDVVISSYSTALIEAAVAGQPVVHPRAGPVAGVPAHRVARLLPHLRSEEELIAAVVAREDGDSPLARWARSAPMSRATRSCGRRRARPDPLWFGPDPRPPPWWSITPEARFGIPPRLLYELRRRFPPRSGRCSVGSTRCSSETWRRHRGYQNASDAGGRSWMSI